VPLQMPEQIVDRLFCDPHTIREPTRTYSLEAGIAPESDVRCAQIVESCRNDSRIQLYTDPLPNDTEQGSDVRWPLAIGAGGIA
jgi:hypothetical protein